MTARLTLLCHAGTPALRSAAFPADEPLDAKGLAAATALAGRFPRAARVLVSPARRAVQTAAAMGFAGQEECALRECDYGRWSGRALDEIAAVERDAVEQWMAEPDARPHGGESIAALVERVGGWMDADKTKGKVLAVTHASVVRAAVLHALGAPARCFWRIDVAPLSVTELRRNGPQWTLRAARL